MPFERLFEKKNFIRFSHSSVLVRTFDACELHCVYVCVRSRTPYAVRGLMRSDRKSELLHGHFHDEAHRWCAQWSVQTECQSAMPHAFACARPNTTRQRTQHTTHNTHMHTFLTWQQHANIGSDRRAVCGMRVPVALVQANFLHSSTINCPGSICNMCMVLYTIYVSL